MNSHYGHFTAHCTAQSTVHSPEPTLYTTVNHSQVCSLPRVEFIKGIVCCVVVIGFDLRCYLCYLSIMPLFISAIYYLLVEGWVIIFAVYVCMGVCMHILDRPLS